MTRRVRFTPLLWAGCLATAALVPRAEAREVPYAPPATVLSGLAGTVGGVAAADFDRDGDDDLLAALPIEGEVVWLRNAGTGTTWTAATIATGAPGLRALVPADVDRDGDLDAVSATPGLGRVAWHENVGVGGPWVTRTIAAGLADARAVAVADLDRDGRVDVVAAASDGIAWYENPGPGSSAWTARPVGTGGAAGVVTIDVDRDGDSDVVAATPTGTVWYENTPAAFLPHPIAPGAIAQVAAADLDRDGAPDVLAMGPAIGLVWYERDGAGAWSAHAIATAGAGVLASLVADVDSDSDPDVWIARAGAVGWYDNAAGDGSAWSLRTAALQDGAGALAVADLDGDGDADPLSAGGAPGAPLVRHANETLHRTACFAPSAVLATFGTIAHQASSLLPVDVDRDGDLDAVTNLATQSRVLWYENPAAPGPWTPHTLTTVIVRTTSLAEGDIDGDGDADVLVHLRGEPYDDRGIFWLENPGTGDEWARHAVDTGYFYPWWGRLHLSDLDGDGDLDGVFGAEDEFSFWYRNDGPGAPWGRNWLNSANDAEVADVDRDGDPDLYTMSSGTARWLENRLAGGGEFIPHVIAAGFDAYMHRAGDVDGDGGPDMMSNTNVGSDLVWYRRLPTGQFASSVVSGHFSDSVQVADLDRDGDGDLLTRTGVPAAWYENTLGDATAWVPRTIEGPDGAWVRAVDLDRDGDLDVLGARETLRLHENQGGQVSLAASNLAPAIIPQGNLVTMLAVVATNRARSGEGPVELASFGIRLEEAAGDPLTSDEANRLVESLRVYRDSNGNGSFDPADALVGSVDTLALADGEQLLPFADGDANVTVPHGVPRTFWVVLQLTEDAGVQSPNRVRATLLQTGSRSSQAEHAAYDIPVDLMCPTDVASAGVVATVPVQLIGLTVE